MLNVYQCQVGYRESIIIRDVSLKVKQGQVVCLLGRNGVGKTTLVKGIMGLLPFRHGNMQIEQTNVTNDPPYKRAKHGMGYVPQGREIFPHLTVYENICLGLEGTSKRDKRAVEKMLEIFPALKPMLKRKGGDLSGGQQQQLAFARAMIANPKLLILDEPTEGIQPSIVQEIQELIVNMKQQHTVSMLLVEQSIDFVRQVGDYFYMLEKGEIVAEGAIEALTDQIVKQHVVV
ncbi:urea ABC transporter ATP-binding subunit UrtE [Longirhabdus pacifica]|uniref:urea ABC transporter ATP-binding subunit UrtE n=1 Tax=Longirhabdus pacifica TaxID=2305227 RepID=UPI001008FEFD|nr:urea ABC transporter ATP-binding subunit UrtE [Longirhabdus pacifica]